MFKRTHKFRRSTYKSKAWFIPQSRIEYKYWSEVISDQYVTSRLTRALDKLWSVTYAKSWSKWMWY